MWDCVIVGGGPAGLTAATYLGRFEREVLLVDAGESRVKRIPLSRNTPGFPDGVTGSDLLARMQSQASRYGALFRGGVIEEIKREGEGFCLQLNGQGLRAKTVLLATGVRLSEPSIANLDEGLRRGLVRYCPICDGYEARDLRIAVLGGRPGAIAEALFLRTYSDRVTYLYVPGGELTSAELLKAGEAGITVARAAIETITLDEYVRVIDREGGRDEFDVLYPCIGCEPQSALAAKAGALCSSEAGVLVDAHQCTTIPGLYAAGDVLQGLDQIASACGQGAIAAVAIHNRLRQQN
jgi:thioredoxin reductase (NADPH)